MLVAADGMTMTDSIKLMSQTPNPISVFTLCTLCITAMILLMLLFTSKNESGKNNFANGERAEGEAEKIAAMTQ